MFKRLAFLAAMAAAPAAAQPTADVALVLAADVSGSMSVEEATLQREAYAAALTHPDVMQAIREGAHGRIFLTYFEWSDCVFQRVLVSWTTIDDPSDLAAVAKAIKAGPPTTGLNTCLTGALERTEKLLSVLPEPAERYVLDISGDGEHNTGIPPWDARERLLARGVTINAIPIVVDLDSPTLVEWYGTRVIGGPGAFMEPVASVDGLEPALRRKLVQEIG